MFYNARCVGLPDGPCPNNRFDESVRCRTGDLMLCSDCDNTRHQLYLATLKPLSAVNEPNGAAARVVVSANISSTLAIASNVSHSASVASVGAVQSTSANRRRSNLRLRQPAATVDVSRKPTTKPPPIIVTSARPK